MLFKNKIEYTKGMFVEIYGTEIKKVRLVLRIITGIAVVAAIAFMIYGAAARGFIMPGDFFNLGISILMALLCTFLPNLMARSQMKKCKKRGLLGERHENFIFGLNCKGVHSSIHNSAGIYGIFCRCIRVVIFHADNNDVV